MSRSTYTVASLTFRGRDVEYLYAVIASKELTLSPNESCLVNERE